MEHDSDAQATRRAGAAGAAVVMIQQSREMANIAGFGRRAAAVHADEVRFDAAVNVQASRPA